MARVALKGVRKEFGQTKVIHGVDLEIDALCMHPYGYYGWGIVLPEERPGIAHGQRWRMHQRLAT